MSNKTQNAVDVINQINEQAKKSVARHIKLTDKQFAVGKKIRQGDLYITRLEKLPKNLGEVTKNAQLAVGNTQGSRHIINPVPKGLTLYTPAKDANVLTGPIVDASTKWTLTHPEHGHFTIPAGQYAVSYQRDFSAERKEELRRVAD